ncbi:uncharacterized protein [Palaemon carinicauda]|uniref:uncharacterized protein n=1 Tax=Palaemon carinicauda TaxID=392227 RepID=UPI0035B68879
MHAWLLLLLSGCALANTVPDGEKVLTLTYDEPSVDGKATMDVHVLLADQVIRYHMLEQGNLADVETFEDYETGFAASRVNDEENCFIRQLNSTIEEAVKKIEELSISGPQKPLGEEKVLAISAEDVEEWAGERILNFCGDFPIYKLVKPGDEMADDAIDTSVEVMEQENRVSVYFTKCFFFFFFFKCITVTITIPTGTTIFLFFFG